MEMTIRSKFMSKEILENRRKMIENEKLHIQDELYKDGFKLLYKKYGSGFDEKDFAWAFLDIDELRYYNLDTEKTAKTQMLLYEYISNEEFDIIRNQVVEEYGLVNGERRSSEEIFEMYEKFSDRLSIGLFLEEILGIKRTIIKNFKKGDTKSGKINFDAKPGEYNTFNSKKQEIPMYALKPDYIYELRKKLFLEGGLCVGDSISYEQIQKLNIEFCPDLSEMVFAEKAIGITANQYNALKRNKSKKPQNGLAFQDVAIPNQYLKELSNKIAMLHKLEAGQLLKREDFYDYYNKYGGILSKKSFATLVLEMTDKGYSDSIQNEVQASATILSSRKKTDFTLLSKRIVKAEGLHHGDMLRYGTFKKIHELYSPNVSEFIFAEKILGIKSHGLQNMKYNNGRSRINLELPCKKELKELQKRVILENNIHINDELNYKEVERLYSIYGGILPIKMFAIEILGLEKQSFLRIKNHEDKKAFALFNLQIPRLEINKLKQKIIEESNLQKNRELTLEEIERLYSMYGGIMSLKMFLSQILGINIESFNHLKDKKQENTMSCIRQDFNDDEIKEVKKYLAEGLTDAKIAIRMGVTTTFLRININHLIESYELTEHNMICEKVKLLINRGSTPEEIQEKLNIDEEFIKEIIYLLKKEEEEEERNKQLDKKLKKSENKEIKRKVDIKRRAIKAVDDYEYKDKSIKNVRSYIGECRKEFEKGIFERTDLDFLMECMIFVQCNCEEIELFVEMCRYFKEYKMASSFIMENIDNEDIVAEEKVKLIDLKKAINYDIKKEQVINLLKLGKLSPQEISKSTGVSETEVIKIKKIVDAEKVVMLGDKERTM